MSDLNDVEILETIERFDDHWFLCKLGYHSTWVGVTAIAAREAARLYRLSPSQVAKVRMFWRAQTGIDRDHLIGVWEFYDQSFEQILKKAAGPSEPAM